MKKSHRNITSLLMTAIYLLIVFSPLTPLAMQSKMVAHAVTGECSGDCKIDGCPLDRSANHTCCCWQKKQHTTGDDHLHSSSDIHSESPTQSVEVPQKKSGKSSCCFEQDQESEKKTGDESSVQIVSNQKNDKGTATISSRHCGNGKLFALLSVEAAQHLPFVFTNGIPSPEQNTLTYISPKILTSRCCAPPVPPPQSISIS